MDLPGEVFANRPSVPGTAFQRIKDRDWVRVSGTFRDDSKPHLQYVKSSDEDLLLGHITISSLENLTR
jgi:hypothetical protein